VIWKSSVWFLGPRDEAHSRMRKDLAVVPIRVDLCIRPHRSSAVKLPSSEKVQRWYFYILGAEHGKQWRMQVEAGRYRRP